MSLIRTKSAVSHAKEIVIARICPGSDLIQGIEKICKDHCLTSGTVISGIGSLEHATFIYVVPDEDSPVGAAYVDPLKKNGPMELLSLQGTFGLTDTGELSVHIHGMVSDPDLQVWGGHFVPNGNPVLATAELTLCATPDVALTKAWDEETQFELFNPSENPAGS